ncbi:MAG: hypothetical protein WD771_11490 [Gemmatimonadaceae bacterium]
MTSESPDASPSLTPYERSMSERIPVLAGLLGALIGGGVWALIAALTETEVGFVAWGVGGLTGFMMSRASPARGKGPALAAAALAALGLLAGKALLHEYVVKPAIVKSIVEDDAAPAGVGVWMLRSDRAFPTDVQAELDAVPAGDTLSDALWAQMQVAGQQHFDTLPTVQRDSAMQAYAAGFIASIPVMQQVGWHFSGFDILWFLLAITTAWRMMSRPSGAPAEE